LVYRRLEGEIMTSQKKGKAKVSKKDKSKKAKKHADRKSKAKKSKKK